MISDNYSVEYNCKRCADSITETVYGSDEFRMYAYKIKRCPRTRSHDWTECPYAHRGEKAQRRDPRKFNYSAVACSDFRNGKCPKGDFCDLAHGIFEYWLHPARYRTRACNAGRYCDRKVCFFAHTPEQLRSHTKYSCHFGCRTCMGGSDDVKGAASESTAVVMRSEVLAEKGVSDILKSLRVLKVKEEENEVDRNVGFDGSDSDLPNIGWIWELVQ